MMALDRMLNGFGEREVRIRRTQGQRDGTPARVQGQLRLQTSDRRGARGFKKGEVATIARNVYLSRAPPVQCHKRREFSSAVHLPGGNRVLGEFRQFRKRPPSGTKQLASSHSDPAGYRCAAIVEEAGLSGSGREAGFRRAIANDTGTVDLVRADTWNKDAVGGGIDVTRGDLDSIIQKGEEPFGTTAFQGSPST